MSLDSNALVRAVKQAAVDAVTAQNPVKVSFGTVISVNPVQIRVDQKIVLGPEQLLLTSLVSDFDVDVTPLENGVPAPHYTGYTEGGLDAQAFANHRHDISGRVQYRIHLGLQEGEQVVLLRCDGGQKFLVLDRWREAG